MKKNRFIIGFIFLIFFKFSFAQNKQIQISFLGTFGQNNLSLTDSVFDTKDSNQLQIETLKFYISNVQLLNNGKLVLEEKNSFYLVDIAEKNPFKISLQNNNNIVFDKIKFNIGIDSFTNVSGAMGGDLDPTKGMYWTWQNGYINFKLEGKSQVCKTRNNEFQFHLGGYQFPNYSMQTISFLVNNSEKIQINIDVQKILHQIDLSKTNQIMSPSVEAVLLTKIVANAFSISGN